MTAVEVCSSTILPLEIVTQHFFPPKPPSSLLQSQRAPLPADLLPELPLIGGNATSTVDELHVLRMAFRELVARSWL